MSAEQFSERYRSLEDGELLALALQRQQLAAQALAALDAELSARNLGDEAVHEFEDHLRTKSAAETEVAAETKMAVETESTAGELPPPRELPDDWFDDYEDATPASRASSRPKGVTLTAYLFWLSGAINAIQGTWLTWGDAATASLRVPGVGVLLMGIGVLEFAIGLGLWRLRARARRWGAAVCWAWVGFASFVIVAAAIMKLRGVIAVEPLGVIWLFFVFLWQLTLALYLGSKKAREAFVAAAQPQP
jgi:hypothetical protein